MKANLRGHSDFQKVYQKGRRFEGHFLTAFVLPNALATHRLGVTASRKTLGKAVQRNRAKRMLRETFRLSAERLSDLQAKYDWVLNAKRTLSSTKVTVSLDEFERMMARVAREMAVETAVGRTSAG